MKTNSINSISFNANVRYAKDMDFMQMDYAKAILYCPLDKSGKSNNSLLKEYNLNLEFKGFKGGFSKEYVSFSAYFYEFTQGKSLYERINCDSGKEIIDNGVRVGAQNLRKMIETAIDMKSAHLDAYTFTELGEAIKKFIKIKF